MSEPSKAASPPAAQRTPARRGGLKEAADTWLSKNSSLVLRQTPRWAQGLALVFIAMGTTAVVGGVFFRIDEVITVQGQLVSSTGNQEVKAPVGGKVQAVFFRDGELVRKGQPLMRFDTRQAADEQATLNRLITLEQADLREKEAILSGREAVLRQKLNTQESIVGELERLVRSGGYQRIQYLQQRDQLLGLRNDLAQIALERSRTGLEAQKSIGQMRNRLKTAELQLQYQNVLAPVDGIVFQPKARSQGVLTPGEIILTLVPQTGLRAQINVPNKDIGFVKSGLKAKVRVDAFPFTRYGELEGVVSQIGADALPPDPQTNFYRFPVKLTLNRSYLQSQGVKIPLRAGMAITANLKLREKRLISILSDLLVDQTESIKSLRQ